MADGEMKMKIIIVGAGALGSHLVQFLRNLEVSLKIIDFDRIEQRNIRSQFHPKGGVGRGKVQYLAQTMQFLWGIKIEIVPHKLTSNNASQLLGGADLVVDCLDNGEARRIIQGFVRDTETACLHGALSADGAFGRVIWDSDFKADDEDVVGTVTCEDGGFLPFIALASSYLALSVQEYVLNGKKIGFHIHGSGSIRV